MASTNPVNQSVKLTKLIVDKTPAPLIGQLLLRDTELKGFGLRVTAGGAKSFILEKRIKGRVRRITIGRYPGITAEQARKEAQKLLGHIITGHDPMAERAQARIQGITLVKAFDDFLQTRANLKERTKYDYRRLMKVAFPDWQRKPLTLITKDLVAKRHGELGDNRGEAYANLAMRFLRAVLNFARAQYEDPSGHSILFENPVSRLTHTRAWYRIDRRQTLIKPHQLHAWYQAVNDLKAGSLNIKVRPRKGRAPVNKEPPKAKPAEIVADYLSLLLFTGLRRQEAATLRWDNVDLQGRTLTIPDPKNHEPLTLPLSDFVHALLTARQANVVNEAEEYVFSGRGAQGYLVEPRLHIERVIEASGVTFSLHDLRRTFITIAESLDIPAYAIKRLVNHKMSRDVTAGYIISDVERLRRPMQQITNFLLLHIRNEAASTVVTLPAVEPRLIAVSQSTTKTANAAS
jgi:integrase